ncbi:MAG: ExsB family transcriptional regulator, partial [Thermodesulfobacteriota bacterium]
MTITEIPFESLDAEKFIDEKCRKLVEETGGDIAVNALSGGVDSSVTTMLAHRAIGSRLKTYFIDNGLMREKEPESVISVMTGLGVPVER